MNLQVQCISAKVGKMIELGSIYIKGHITSGKIPTRILTKSSAVGFAHSVERGGDRAVRI